MTRADVVGVADETWVLTDGSVGMENQGLAVAEAVGLPVITKRVRRTGPWRWLPTTWQLAAPALTLISDIDRSGDFLNPPWPRLVISIGRHSVPLTLAIRRLSGGRTFAVHIQNPKVPLSRFDLVTAPLHDALEGGNVVTTLGAPHRVTAARLAAQEEEFARAVAGLPRPRVTVLLGGNSKAFRFAEAEAIALCDDLAALHLKTGCSFLVTPSRRTGETVTNILRARLATLPAVIWDGRGPNPYFGYLALGDAIVATSDSVNMVTEAAGTGKPVYVYPLPGKSKRFARFHAEMERCGATRPFVRALAEGLASWRYTPINDTARVADAIKERMARARVASPVGAVGSAA